MYTVVSAVDSELNVWTKDTKEEVKRLIAELVSEDSTVDYRVFVGEPLKVSHEIEVEWVG